MADKRPANERDRFLVAQIHGTAKRHAQWRELNEDEHAAAVGGSARRGSAAGLDGDKTVLREKHHMCSFSTFGARACLQQPSRPGKT